MPVTPRSQPEKSRHPGEPANRPHISSDSSPDPEALVRNLTLAVQDGGRALAAYLKGQTDQPDGSAIVAGQISDMAETLAKIGHYWTSDPTRMIEAQTRLWGNYLAIWSGALQNAAGSHADPPQIPDKSDRRFTDPDWSANPMLDALKQLYLATTRWALELVENTKDVDQETRDKARFYISQINNALAPTNFPITNPEVLRATAASNAENLAAGMRMLAEDLESGKGTLRIRQTDTSKFEVGENLANTPGKVIAENELCQIIQYAPSTKEVLKRPLVIVPPWINKFYILDLNPEKSFIGWAIENGHTVFVISWVNPDRRHADKDFADYMHQGILFALDTVKQATGESRVNSIGYCVGGTLLAITLAYMAATGDKRIASATFLTTQVDFTDAGDLKVFASKNTIESIEKQMRETGYLEGSQMATAFNLLRSNDLIWPYVVNNYFKGKEPMPFDLLYWNADATRMPCANHASYLRNCYLENNLAKGNMAIDGVPLKLEAIKTPVYHLATREDHIAPANSVIRGATEFGGPSVFVLAGSGHIAGVINPPARMKYQYWTGPKPKIDLEDWLEKAKEHAGSWWPHWQKWVTKRGNAKVPARKPGGKRLKPIEDAPGSYVKVRD